MIAPVLDLVLDPPIKVGRITYDRLHLEEPTARMLETAEKEFNGGTSIYALRRYQIAFVSVAAGVPRAVVLAMPVSQVIQASNFLCAFVAPEPVQPAKTKQKRKGKKRRAREAAPQ